MKFPLSGTRRITVVFLVLSCVLFFAFPLAASDSPSSTRNVSIQISNRTELDRLVAQGFNIVSRHGNTITLDVSREQQRTLRAYGFSPMELPAEKASSDYHTYDSLIEELQDLETLYPSICSLMDLGLSEGGTLHLWAVKISDNVDENEVEPRVIFDGSIHGDEQIGTELILAFIHRLLEGYETNDEYGALVDQFEMYFIPVVNPDGYAAVRRTNSNSVDLNRNFPINWINGGSSPGSEAETQIMTDFYIRHAPADAVQFHSGAELINYPLDSTPQPSPDENLFIEFSQAYGDLSTYEIINGWDWYQANGIAEETNYYAAGAISVIVELSNFGMPAGPALANYINQNLPAMKKWVQLADSGVCGTIIDESTSAPVEARITVDDLFPVYTDPEIGDFCKPLLAGSHDVTVSANGYTPQTFTIVAADGGPAVQVNVNLEPITDSVLISAFRVIGTTMNRPFNDYGNETFPRDALGEPDSIFYSIGTEGVLDLDFGFNSSLAAGGIVTITEDEDDGAESYTVYLAEEMFGPWSQIGDGTGSDSFTVPEDGPWRYLRIVDDSSGSSGDPNPGLDVDAVTYTASCPLPTVDPQSDVSSGTAPLTVQFAGSVDVLPGCLISVLWDFADETSSTEMSPAHTFEHPGDYAVVFTAYGSAGNDSDTIYIHVDEAVDDDSTDDDTDTPDDDSSDDSVDDTDDDSGNDDQDDASSTSGSNDDDDSGCGC